MSTSESIAIIGMECRVPGARDPEQLWQNLAAGVESITFFRREELIAEGVPPELVDSPSYVPAAGILEDVELFDASFFGMSPREAALTDPQHRLFLERAWALLERTGYAGDDREEVIGVYAGADFNTYLVHNVLPHVQRTDTGVGSFQAVLASDKDYLSSRVSYKLDLRGPSLTVQTACSSALVAVHLACQALLAGECDLALAGGVSVTVPHRVGYSYQSGIVSPDGHCRAFDARAGGTVGGNGVGLVLLMRLDDAIEAGATVHAIIRGTAVNNDGSDKVGYTAPSVRGQAMVIAEALSVAGVSADSISYVEAHGTGTQLGDPIEIEALTRAFRGQTARTGFCAIGSIKSNIGHLNAAAGVAGLIKTVLALRHRQLPPSLHFQRPNPAIDFAASPFHVQDRLAPWHAADEPRRAGVSSFGIGGTNAHVVVEEWPHAPSTSSSSRDWHVLALSARSQEALVGLSEGLVERLEQSPGLDLADVAYTLMVGRRNHGHRCAIVCRTAEEAVAVVRAGAVRRGSVGDASRPVALVLPGDSGHRRGAGRDLYLRFDELRAHVEACCASLPASLAGELLAVLNPPSAAKRADDLIAPWLADAASFVIEHSLAQLWRTWGVEPEAMVGCGVGELVASCLSGVLPVEEGLRLAMSEHARFEVPIDRGLAALAADRSWIVLSAGVSVAAATDDATPRLGSLSQGNDETDLQVLAGSLAQLWLLGVPVSLRGYYAGERRRRVELPIHPLQRERHWLDPVAPPKRPASKRPTEHVAELIDRLGARIRESKRLAAAHRRVHADNRSIVRFRSAWKELCHPLVIRRSRGSRLWDVDGNEYVDLTMGFGVNLFGHSPPFLIDALARRVEAGYDAGPHAPLAAEVARQIQQCTGVERVAFCNTGTEAVMLALRIARAATGRSKIALFARSYHGSYDGLLAKSGRAGAETFTVPAVTGVPPRMVEDAIVLEYASPESLEILRRHAHELAAVLVEPVQSRRPDLVPVEYLRDLRELTARAGVLLVFDEIITGFRMHPGGAQAMFDVQADLVTYGKVVGGGLPIGVVGGRAEPMDAFERSSGRPLDTGTFCKHPLAMAAAHATLEAIITAGPALQERLDARTSTLVTRLDAELARLHAPLRMVRFGSLFSFAPIASLEHVELLLCHLLEHGVYVWEGGTCFLSTAHTDEDLDHVVGAVRAGVERMMTDGLL